MSKGARTKGRAFSGFIPDAKAPGHLRHTKSVDRYIDAWRKLAAPIAAATSRQAVGYEPGIAFTNRLHLDTDVCLLLYKALTGKPFEHG